MPRAIAAAHTDLIGAGTHRRAWLWDIQRTDGGIFRFTSFSRGLSFNGSVYTPAGGPDVTSSRKETTLETQGREILAAINSEAITVADLRAGKFQRAIITERLVDWLYPFLGAFVTNEYEVVTTEWDTEAWEARVDDLGRYLEAEVGRVTSRTCTHEYGDDGCKRDISPDGPGVETGRLAVPYEGGDTLFQFQTGVSAAAGFYDRATITWVDGPNIGRTSVVRTHTKPFIASFMTLTLPVPFPIDDVGGHTFNIIPGCNKLAGIGNAVGDCVNKHNNLVNFGGQPHIKGPDASLWQAPLG